MLRRLLAHYLVNNEQLIEKVWFGFIDGVLSVHILKYCCFSVIYPIHFLYQTSDTKVDKEYFFLWFSLWSLHSELNADNNNPCQITYHVTIANCYFNIRLICPSIIQIPDLFVEIITVVMHTYFCCTHNMSSWGLSFLSWPIGDLCGLRRGWPFMCILKVKPNWNTLIGNKFFGNSGDGLSRSPFRGYESRYDGFPSTFAILYKSLLLINEGGRRSICGLLYI